MNRVVITGMGIIAPNAHGLNNFSTALREGRSGIEHFEKLKELKFGCQIGGVPKDIDTLKKQYFSEDVLLAMNSSMIYAGIAGLDCWRDANLPEPNPTTDDVDWDTGAIIGTGIGGADTLGEIVVPNVNAGNVRRLGSTMVEQTMSSSVSARLGGLLGLGGQVTTNSSACTTGTEAVINGFFQIKDGHAKRIIAGGTEGCSHYIWAGFDAMRVLTRSFNDQPQKGSRPMSASSTGFVPSSGSGLLMLESLESAKSRGARIYAEIIGANANSGGQRGKGSMTLPNPIGVKRCIRAAIDYAGISPSNIDLINGHLTGTMADPIEVENWRSALEITPEKFPIINSTKSLIGHALGAAGGIECVASVLQLYQGFVHASLNCEDLHPSLLPFSNSIPHECLKTNIKILAKASFGFGDVNGCLILKKWEN